MILDTEERVKVLDVLIRTLGTMVIEPRYESDPNEIGKKIMLGPVQRPIIEGEDRKIVEQKILDLIKDIK